MDWDYHLFIDGVEQPVFDASELEAPPKPGEYINIAQTPHHPQFLVMRVHPIDQSARGGPKRCDIWVQSSGRPNVAWNGG